MVLPPPVVDAGQDPASGLLRRLSERLRLGHAGRLFQIRQARRAGWRSLLRFLEPEHGRFVVCMRAWELEQVPAGSLVLLRFHPDDAHGLNMWRPNFSLRGLRVLVWTAEADEETLRAEAPDLRDWFSYTFDLPVAPPLGAPEGLAAALKALPRVVWRDEREVLITRWGGVDPSRNPQIQPATLPYEALRERASGPGWHGWDAAHSPWNAWRVRWASAEVGSAAVLVRPAISLEGWVELDDHEDLDGAWHQLSQHGFSEPGRVLALVDADDAAVAAIVALREAGVLTDEICTWIEAEGDPGVVLGRALLARGLLVEAARPCLARAGWTGTVALWESEYAAVEAGLLAGAREALRERVEALGQFDVLATWSTNDVDRAFWLGRWELREGRYNQAVRLLEQVVAAEPEGWRAQVALGEALLELERMPEARRRLEEALIRQAHTLGEDHPETLITRRVIAVERRLEGDLQGGAAALSAVMERQIAVLGAESTDTLETRLGMLDLRPTQDEAALAERAAVLATIMRQLGPEHRLTLVARHNLAGALADTGRLAEAEVEYRAVIEAGQRVLGHDHPWVFLARLGLSHMLVARGDRAARGERRAVLDDARRVFGAGHPILDRAERALANSLFDEGDFGGAERLQAPLAERLRLRLGSEHPQTLAVLDDLAQTLLARGEDQRALELQKMIVASRALRLGARHPETLLSQHNLATAWLRGGHLRRAIKLGETVLRGRTEVLGADHPFTLTTELNLAAAQIAASDLESARATLEPLVERCLRVHGEGHESTRIARYQLARVLLELDPAAAATHIHALSALREQDAAMISEIERTILAELPALEETLASASSD